MLKRMAAAAIAAIVLVAPASADYKRDDTAYVAALDAGCSAPTQWAPRRRSIKEM